MSRMHVVRAVAWQIYGGAVALIFSLSLLAEALWWTFFFYDRSILRDAFLVGRVWPWLVHVFMAVSALALFHYERTRHKREQVLDLAGAAARLEGRGPSFFIGPFRVKIEIAFFAFPALFGIMTGDVARAAFFVVSATLAVLAHELAHAAAARISDHKASITLNLLGGLTNHYGPLLTRAQHTFIAVVGPLSGIILGGAAYGLTHAIGARGLLGDVLSEVVFVNLGWGVLNLMPVLPLDGGRIVESLLRKPQRAELVSVIAATAIAAFAFQKLGPESGMIFLTLAAINAVRFERVQRVLLWISTPRAS